MSTQFVLTCYEVRKNAREEGLLDHEALAHATGLHPDLVQRLFCIGLLEPVAESGGKPLYSEETILRLRRMLRLRRDLGLSWHSLGLVMDLLERVEALEAQLKTVVRDS